MHELFQVVNKNVYTVHRTTAENNSKFTNYFRPHRLVGTSFASGLMIGFNDFAELATFIVGVTYDKNNGQIHILEQTLCWVSFRVF